MEIRCNYIFSLPGMGKSATIILGLVVLILGIHSHFESAWVDRDFHKICVLDRIHNKNFEESCPKLSMERFYVAVVIICFILSIFGLILSTTVLSPFNRVFYIFDLGYHICSAVFLLLGAILYIVSAVQIKNNSLINGDRDPGLLPPNFRLSGVNIFLSTEKIISGVLTIILSGVYIGVAFLIKRGKSRADGNLYPGE